MEAELVEIEATIIEVEWLWDILMDIPMVAKPVSAIQLYCDNQTVITNVLLQI
jgi:hypothetical protein